MRAEDYAKDYDAPEVPSSRIASPDRSLSHYHPCDRVTACCQPEHGLRSERTSSLGRIPMSFCDDHFRDEREPLGGGVLITPKSSVSGRADFVRMDNPDLYFSGICRRQRHD